MNNKKVGVIIALVVVVLLAIGSFFYFSNSGNGKAEEIKKPVGTTQPTSSPSPTEETKAPVDKVDKNKEATLEETIQGFEKPAKNQNLEGYSEKEINESIAFASEYTTVALTNEYFLGGAWEKDNYNIENLKDMMAPYYSSELLKNLDKAEEKTGEEFANAIMPYTMYLGNNGSVKPSPYCGADAKDYQNCALTPLKYSEVDYYVTDMKDGNNQLVLKFNVAYDLAVTIVDGDKDAKTTVTYSYGLVLDRTPSSTDKKTQYEIVKYDTSYKLSKVVEVK